MHKYKVTCLFVPDWAVVYQSLFGSAVHCASSTEGSVGTFTFATPQTPADLGPLVRVELLTNDNP
jgi:hypothetical protein